MSIDIIPASFRINMLGNLYFIPMDYPFLGLSTCCVSHNMFWRLVKHADRLICLFIAPRLGWFVFLEVLLSVDLLMSGFSSSSESQVVLKGMVLRKTNWVIITHPHVIPELYEFLVSVEHRDILLNFNGFPGFVLDPIDLHYVHKRSWIIPQNIFFCVLWKNRNQNGQILKTFDCYYQDEACEVISCIFSICWHNEGVHCRCSGRRLLIRSYTMLKACSLRRTSYESSDSWQCYLLKEPC